MRINFSNDVCNVGTNTSQGTYRMLRAFCSYLLSSSETNCGIYITGWHVIRLSDRI